LLRNSRIPGAGIIDSANQNVELVPPCQVGRILGAINPIIGKVCEFVGMNKCERIGRKDSCDQHPAQDGSIFSSDYHLISEVVN
jgi:hypothetical protein